MQGRKYVNESRDMDVDLEAKILLYVRRKVSMYSWLSTHTHGLQK